LGRDTGDLPPAQIDVEARCLVQELQVHQVELEMQNEELMQARDEIASLLGAYTDLYDFAPVGYITLDKKGTVLKANLTAATLLGSERSRLLGIDFSRVLAKESQAAFSGFIGKRFKGMESVAYCDLACQNHPGRVAWIRMEAFGAIAHEEFRVALLDISERKVEEEARGQAEARIAQAQHLEAIGELSAGVAHNINNVLTAIMATAEVRQMLTSSTDDLKAFEIIDTACKRGRDVVRSLVQFAHPCLSQIAPVNLHNLLVEICQMLEVTAQSRIKIEKEFSAECFWVSGNAGTLSSAFWNLCHNALDALPDGGTLTLRTTELEQDWVGVSVEDNGTGMAPEILAKVLDPFFTTKPVGQGTGLGLSMAYGVIKAHGGSLAISSQLGKGTVVAIRIPRTPALVKDVGPEPHPSMLNAMDILLVDDDEDVRFLTSRLFKAGGMNVSCAEGGEQALAYLRTHALPDLVILDQNMPGIDGIQTMGAIRALHPDLPILISSGRMDIEGWECFKRPKIAFLSKPFDLVELREKLRKMGLKSKDTFEP